MLPEPLENKKPLAFVRMAREGQGLGGRSGCS